MSSSHSIILSFKNNKSQIATITIASTLFVLVSYIIFINFSYYWDFLHSDIVADLAFIREAASSFSLFPYGWAHINEMRFIYITTIAIPFYWITSNVHAAYSLAVSFMLITNLALFYYMLSFKKRNIVAVLTGAIIFLIFFSRYTMFSTFSILFVNGTLSTHLATIFLTLGVYLRIKCKTSTNFKWEKALWIITLLLAFAQGIQSPRMIVVLYTPLFFIELLPILRSMSNKETKMKGLGLLYALAAFLLNAAGMMFVNLLTSSGAIVLEEAGITSGSSIVNTNQFIERILQSITTLFYTFGLIGGNELFSTEGLVFVIRIGFIIAIVFIYKSINKDAADKNLVDILMTTVVFSVLSQALIFLGMGERFNLTATSLIAVMFVISLCNIIEEIGVKKIASNDNEQDITSKRSIYGVFASGFEPQIIQKCLAGGLVIMVLVGALLSVNALGLERHRNSNLIADRQRVVDFLEEQNLTVGYGAFWQSLAITGVANWEAVVIPFHSNHGVVGRPLRQGVAHSDFFHNEERVFLIGSVSHLEEAYDHDRMGPILQQGERHDLPGSWVVYIFDFNPWAEFKQ